MSAFGGIIDKGQVPEDWQNLAIHNERISGDETIDGDQIVNGTLVLNGSVFQNLSGIGPGWYSNADIFNLNPIFTNSTNALDTFTMISPAVVKRTGNIVSLSLQSSPLGHIVLATDGNYTTPTGTIPPSLVPTTIPIGQNMVFIIPGVGVDGGASSHQMFWLLLWKDGHITIKPSGIGLTEENFLAGSTMEFYRTAISWVLP